MDILLLNLSWLDVEALVAQHLEALALLVVVAVLVAVEVVLVRMPLLAVAVAVMAQYLFGLGSLINDNMY
jgi:hypothetical protein